jgi:uroporphyrinogen-III synthase
MPKHLFNQTKKVLLMVNNLRRKKLMRLKMETKMLKAYQAEPPRIVLS